MKIVEKFFAKCVATWKSLPAGVRTQISRFIRLFFLTLLSSGVLLQGHLTVAIIGSAVLASAEVAYRQFITPATADKLSNQP